MTRAELIDRYLCLSVDVAGYGGNDDLRQSEIQAELLGLLDAAGAYAGLHRPLWTRQAKGDEELALIPATEPYQLVVGQFCLELDALLHRRNRQRQPGQRLRLRLALDDGPVQLASNGFVGRPVVAVSRLVNCRPVRQALTLAPDASLAVILSQGVYRDWVSSGRCAARAEWFQAVAVMEKEFVEDAWLWVPGSDVRRLMLAAPAALSSLPWSGRHFTGRETELAAAIAAVRPDAGSGAAAVCAISGMPGVGKTTLAIQVARMVAPDFPDGCVFVDLHGYTVGTEPDQPAEALDRILRQLGFPADRIPQHVDERAAALRATLEGRRFLFVLDNARDVAQVQPLLPTVDGCAALVTGRVRLTALDEATLLPLGGLPGDRGQELFRAVVGSRLPDDFTMDLVNRIVAACGWLPLAIRIVAARVRTDPTCSLAELCDRLEDEQARLPELDDGSRSVAASLTVSCARLQPEQQRLLALLAIHPATAFDVYCVTAMTQQAPAECRRLLNGLVDQHLLGQPVQGRYQFHDLVGVFARTRDLPLPRVADRAGVVHRMVDYYLASAARADRTLTPHRHRIPITLTHSPTTMPELGRPEDARRWLVTEERTLVEIGLLAAAHHLDAQCWQVSHILRGYFFLTKRWESWARTQPAALAAARRLTDGHAEALLLNDIGLSAIEQGRPGDASRYYRAALALFERIGDERGVHTARANLGWTEFYQGRYDEFLHNVRPALAFQQQHSSAGDAAITLRGIALAEIEVGEFDQAIRHLHDARDVFEGSGLDLDLAMTLNALGEAYARLGDPPRAEASHCHAMELSRRCGSVFEGARAQHRLGSLAAAGGDVEAAREQWLGARAAYLALGAPQARDVQSMLDAS